MRALIVRDDRKEAGRGHIVRAQALAMELVHRGWGVEMVGPGDQAVVRDDVIILDLHPEVRAQPPKRCVLIVDDLSPTGPCDLLVNGGAGATVEMYRGKGADRVLAGPQFALLRAAFSSVGPRKRKGIFDARKLEGMDAVQMADAMASSEAVVTYGGMRVMECAATGTPSVVIPRNPGEQMNADGLVAAGAALICTEQEALVMAETALICPRLLTKMGSNAKELVDGKGVKRVVQAIEDLVK